MNEEQKIKIISFAYSLSTLISGIKSGYTGKNLYENRKIEHKIHFQLLAEYMNSFSKKELEVNFYELKSDEDTESKNKYAHVVIGESWLNHQKNLYEIILSADDYDFYIFFKVLLEKKCFEDKLTDLTKLIIKEKQSSNSLEFYHFIYLQEKNYSRKNTDEEGVFKYSVHEFIYNGIFTDEKKEVLNIVLNKMNIDEIVDLIYGSYNEDINQYILNHLKERKLNINNTKYEFGFLPRDNRSNFFISSSDDRNINKLINYGFDFKKYKFKGLDLIENMYLEIKDVGRKPDLDRVNLIMNYISKNPKTINKYIDFFKKDEDKFNKIYPIMKEKLISQLYVELNQEIEKKPEGLKRKI